MTTAVMTPDRSLEQRLAALERANMIRTHRSRVKRDLKAGERSFADVLADSLCDSMKVYDVLLALRGKGRVRARAVLKAAGVSLSKTCGGLSDRQRGELLLLVQR